MLSAVLVASIAVAVILGYKTKINTGFFCIAFAYLIGCFGMGLKTKELIGFWPVALLSITLVLGKNLRIQRMMTEDEYSDDR